VLAGVGVSPALQQVEAAGESLEDLRRREHTGPCGRQLDRERQVIEAATEVCDSLVRLCTRPSAEEIHSFWLGERQDRVLDLSLDSKKFSTRDEQREIRAGLDERGELGCRLDDLLEVVEKKQELTVSDVVG